MTETAPAPHSAGPWVAMRDGNGQLALFQEATGLHLLHGDSPLPSREREANVVLMKAAPDMLAALRLALDHIPERAMVYSKGTYGDRVYIREAVRAAISAAEGRR